jgi:hypothetical protein
MGTDRHPGDRIVTSPSLVSSATHGHDAAHAKMGDAVTVTPRAGAAADGDDNEEELEDGIIPPPAPRSLAIGALALFPPPVVGARGEATASIRSTSSGVTYRSTKAHSRPLATSTPPAQSSSVVGSRTSTQIAGWTCEYDGPCKVRILVVTEATEEAGGAVLLFEVELLLLLVGVIRQAVRLMA